MFKAVAREPYGGVGIVACAGVVKVLRRSSGAFEYGIFYDVKLRMRFGNVHNYAERCRSYLVVAVDESDVFAAAAVYTVIARV